MPGTIAPLPCPDSWLRQFDPRWKLAAFVIGIVAVALLQTIGPALTALAGALLLATVGRLPRRWLLSRLGLLVLALLPFVLVLPFLPHAPGPAWQMGPATLSLHGLGTALLLLLKTLALALLLLVLLTSAPLHDTLKAAQALRVPALLVQLFMLTYRHSFMLADELQRLRVALRVRAYRHRANLHSYRTVGHVAGVLLVRGHERAERVGQAMRCRGFDGHFRSLHGFHTTARDVGLFLCIAGTSAALLAWDLVAP